MITNCCSIVISSLEMYIFGQEMYKSRDTGAHVGGAGHQGLHVDLDNRLQGLHENLDKSHQGLLVDLDKINQGRGHLNQKYPGGARDQDLQHTHDVGAQDLPNKPGKVEHSEGHRHGHHTQKAVVHIEVSTDRNNTDNTNQDMADWWLEDK